MAPPTTNLAPVALILLAGSLVMLWFVILSGVTQASPLRQTYFLRADTSNIQGARPISQWTYFYVCGRDNANCGPAHPALPLGSAWASGASGVPSDLIGSYGDGTTSYYYWYMWRFGWVFYLLALFFEVLALFAGLLACCSSLVSIITGLISLVALVFLTIAVSLMTATFVKMRNVFIGAGRAASLGQYAYGFSWGAWAALLISTILFFLARQRHRDAATTGRNWGWRRRTGATDGRRVKNEYP